MQIKQVKLQLKEIGEKGQFVGLAAVYGNRDQGGDVILPGAFTKTINDRGGKFPLLYGHKVNVGVSLVTDSPDGLLTTGLLNLEKETARDVYSDLRFYKDNGMDFGMSIGYLSIPDKTEVKNGTRYLHEIKLFENTLTEFPMNELARVQQVKTFDPSELDEIEAVIQEIKAGRQLSAATRARMQELMDGHSAVIEQHQGLMKRFQALMDSADMGKSCEPPTPQSEPANDHSAITSMLDELKGAFQWKQ